jgi:hypothetical protein
MLGEVLVRSTPTTFPIVDVDDFSLIYFFMVYPQNYFNCSTLLFFDTVITIPSFELYDHTAAEKSISPVCHLANVPFGECTIWRMNHLANVPFGECTIWLLHKNKNKRFWADNLTLTPFLGR